MEMDDQYLINEYIHGDQDSFKILVEKYTPSIYNFGVRFVGEDYINDVTQDIFIKVWKNIRNFNNDKSSFKTWVFTIARNTITDYLRKKKMVNFSSLDTEEESFADNIADEVILSDEILIKLEDKELLNNFINKLTVNYREVIILYYQEDMTFNEIGQLLGKPLNTVKSYHHRALIKLREMF
jgi:RNA polymerase sigma-70 factor (ECF subfamily)